MPRSTPKVQPQNSLKPLILLVDDNVEVRQMYARFLGENSYRVAVAANAKEAIRKASELAPDLVLMDVSMAGISGTEATRRLKRDAKTKNIPIIMLTAYVLEDPEIDAIVALGALGCLSKLDSPEYLLRAVKSGIITSNSQPAKGGSKPSATRRTKSSS